MAATRCDGSTATPRSSSSVRFAPRLGWRAIVQVLRSPSSPIIRPRMDARMGDNVNGPSLIRAPEWIARPLGRYYLYFGHHNGAYIRLAYADDLEGPWRMYEAGVLSLAQTGFAGHVASPDAHVDAERREVRLYFHGSDWTADRSPAVYSHVTRVALSSGGLDFDVVPVDLGRPYLRAFRWDGWWYALAMPGVLCRSRDGLRGFEEGPALFGPDQRHAAVRLRGDALDVFFTNAGDRPERILRATVRLAGDWRTWRAGPSEVLIEPETEYEGADLPLEASRRGAADRRVRQLRDPAIYEESGRTYLLYAVAGESGIAIAQLL